MTTTTITKVSAKMNRYDELKKMLEDRRCELADKIHGKMRDARTETKEGGVPTRVRAPNSTSKRKSSSR